MILINSGTSGPSIHSRYSFTLLHRNIFSRGQIRPRRDNDLADTPPVVQIIVPQLHDQHMALRHPPPLFLH